MAKRSYEMDMCSGPLLGKIIRYAFPLMLSGILQLLFNAADIVVVGRFSGSDALAAVGSTSALINLLVNVFIGLSIGTNVLVARYIGAQDAKNISETVHTSILLSLIFGVILIFVGLFFSKPLLLLMGSPEGVIDQAALYMKIYFAGMPVNMLYNFGSAVLRALGDTKRPLYFLMIAGVINVCLNMFLVIVFHMGVAGVAIATVASQAISAILVTICLIRADGPYRLFPKRLRVHKDKLFAMIRIGLPAGLQGALFSISNVLIQSSINSFGAIAMAGNTAAGNIEGFIYTSMNALYQSSLSFTGQNMGARKYSRVNRIMLICCGLVTVVGITLGIGANLIAEQLLSIYSSDPEVIAYGVSRMAIVAAPYFICGLMDCMVGCMRGMGYSIMPMIVSLTGACGVRVLWIYTVFAANRTMETLYISYPVSWLLTFLAHLICFMIVRRRFPKEDASE